MSNLDYAWLKITMKFSIIITCFNRKRFIQRCIKSALNQSLVDRSGYEVIVVDDKSTDGSKNIIEQFENTIKIIYNKKNYGLSKSRNLGIKKSKGKYILMLDSDDYISEHYLRFMGSFLDYNASWSAVASDYTKISYSGKYIKRCSFKKEPIACGILYKRKTLFDVGLYNNSLRYLEDVEFRDRYLKKYKVDIVQLPLYRYTIHKKSLTGSSNKTNVK